MPSADLNRNQVVAQVKTYRLQASVNTTNVSAIALARGGPGSNGTNGADGVGIPAGGTTGQVLAKINNTNYNTQWVNQSIGTGTVTSVNGTGANGVTVSGGPITSSGSLTIGLGAITPTSVASVGTVTGSNLSGANTGDQTITLTGDVTGSGTGSFATAIGTGVIVNADVNASAAVALTKLAATTASRALVSDVSGFITPATTTSTEIGYVNGVTSAIQTQLNAKQATGNYITALTGDVTATGPGSVASTLATVNSNVGTFGTATQVPTYTVNAKGLITASANTSIQIAESQVTNLVSDLAAKQGTLSLTTTGTSGAATLIGNTLNIPNYAGGGGGASGITRSVVVTSGNITAGSTALVDYVYIISAAHTVTLPTAVGNTNLYTLKNRHTSPVALAFTSGQTADGGGITLAPNASVDLISDNTNWVIT